MKKKIKKMRTDYIDVSHQLKNNKNYKEAIVHYEKLLNTSYYYTSALALMEIYLNTSQYSKCREILNMLNNGITTNSKFFLLASELEFQEFNYAKSLEFAEKIYLAKKQSLYAYYQIAKIYINLQEYDLAKKIIYKHLLSNSDFYLFGIELLIVISILIKDYQKSKNLLTNIKITEKNQYDINYIKSLLEKNLINDLDNNNTPYRNELQIAKHISKHYNNEDDSYFYNNISPLDLITLIKEKQLLYKPTNINIANQYILELDSTVGEVFNTPTNKVLVFTDFNNPHSIRTTYPCITSDKFDTEQRSRIKK